MRTIRSRSPCTITPSDSQPDRETKEIHQESKEIDLGSQGVAWERCEEGGVGEVPQGTDHGLLRMSSTGVVYGRGGERGALRANAAVEKCEEESPEGDAAVHRARS